MALGKEARRLKQVSHYSIVIRYLKNGNWNSGTDFRQF